MHICFVIAVYLSLEIGYYLLAIETNKDIAHDIDSINKTTTLKNNAAEVSKQMRDSIQFHLNAKQLSINPMYNPLFSQERHIALCICKCIPFCSRLVHEIAEIFEWILTILYLWSIVAMCGSMLLLHMQIV